MKYGTYKLTFPSTHYPPSMDRQEVIKALRVLSPGMGLNEADDLTFASGPQLVKFVYPWSCSSNDSYYDAINTLTENGVAIESCDGTELESRVKSDLAPESIAADIRVMVVNSMKRKEYDTAKALIELLKTLDKI